MEIPFQAIQQDTLRNMIEEFVTRDGTDYGVQEVSLEAKVERVLAQLRAGKAAIMFDESLETCEIVLVQD